MIKNAIANLPPKQKEVFHLIVNLTDKRGFPPTLAEIATQMGLKNKMTVHQHLSALKKKGLVKWQPGLNRSLQVMDEHLSTPKLPLVGTIAAGAPIEAINREEFLEIENNYPGCYALKVKGDSMIEDGIFDGDYVIIKPKPNPSQGEIVVALLDDGTATLKRFYKDKTGFRLKPANKNLQPILLGTQEELQIQGTVVGLFRKF